jgi:sugar phosphate isomerase/epimerase
MSASDDRRAEPGGLKRPRTTLPGPLTLNTVTVRDRWSLAQCIEGCARHGIPGISPWRDKVAEMGVAQAARHIRDAGLFVSGLCRGGMFPAADAAGRAAAIEENRRAIAEAHAIGAPCLVVLGGGLPPGSKDLPGARAMFHDGLAAVLPEARAAGVTLALEPLHPMTCADRSVLSTLAQALDLCEEFGDGTGIALDVYHVWWDPDLARQVARARGRIAGFHVCDWLVPTTDLVFDRGMMGDGVIDIRAIRAMAEAAGYAGPCEVELLSKRWWAEDPEVVLPLIKARHATAC